MSEPHDDTTSLDLELAALGESTPERRAELEGLGYGDAILALEAENEEFHRRHDRDAMLREIERRHQRQTQRTDMTPSTTVSYPKMMLPALGAALLSVGLFTWLTGEQESVETDAEATAPVGVATLSNHDVGVAPCDTSRAWTAAERVAPDPGPPGRLNAYTSSMLTCLERGVEVLAVSPTDRVVLPPRELIYACREHFGFACAALGTLEFSGTSPFREEYLSKGSMRLDSAGATWIWGKMETRTPRVAKAPATGAPAASTTAAPQPRAECDMTRRWTIGEREELHPESIMLAGAHRQSMLTCLDDALTGLFVPAYGEVAPSGDSSGVPAELGYACSQRSSFACVALGVIQLEGSRGVTHGEVADESTRPAMESRIEGARNLRRACALDNLSGCGILARHLSRDEALRQATGDDPETYERYALGVFDGSRGEFDEEQAR